MAESGRGGGVSGAIENYRRIYGEATEVGVPINCYLTLQGHFTMAELVAHFAEHHPAVDPMQVSLGLGGGAHWKEPATPEDVESRRKASQMRDERHEAWEWETFTRLKAKFEANS